MTGDNGPDGGPLRLLLVCMGNICRSPMAQGVFEHKLRERGLSHRVDVDSAGTHRYHVGKAPEADAIEVMHTRGISIDGQRARELESEDFSRFDVILAMDQANLDHLRYVAPANTRARMHLLLEHVRWGNRNIPDPYNGEGVQFERAARRIEKGVEHWLPRLEQLLAERN
jgi:protein-tyrosine phosphatase